MSEERKLSAAQRRRNVWRVQQAERDLERAEAALLALVTSVRGVLATTRTARASIRTAFDMEPLPPIVGLGPEIEPEPPEPPAEEETESDE